jgi:predicted aconitase
MQLNSFETALLDGEHGEPRRRALMQQIEVGRFFDAEDFVEISQVHVMADTESLGEAGVEFLESQAGFADVERRVVVPTVTDPRGIDFCTYRQLRQQDIWAQRERRTIDALRAMGVLTTDTCINYQTISPPVFGEHLAFGDTGSVIYANSVAGARSNFEGGPSALAAALTGRTPRYGYHLDQHRRATHRFLVNDRPHTLSDWGALGGIIGRRTGSYWTVPVIEGIDEAPRSDELKHFGAALASYGSVALFHMVGVTPEAPNVDAVMDAPLAPQSIGRSDLDAFYASFGLLDGRVDVVVFAAPQLSLLEIQQLASLLDGKRIAEGTSLLVATSPEIKTGCDRLGFTATIEQAGGTVLKGVCFYQMYAREMAQANGWETLVTNSAKLTNIIAGYGYRPFLATMEQCVDAAVSGYLAP